MLPFYASTFEVRADLDDAHRRVWGHVSRCGVWWSAAQRRAAAATVIVAFNDPAPTPPWVPYTSDDARRREIAEVSGTPLDDDVIKGAVLDVVARMTAHASSLTSSWYTAITAGDGPALINDQAYVELCGIVTSVTAVCSFARTIGAVLPPLPPLADADRPSRVRVAADQSPRNWVPVAPPGGTQASVIEALSVAPSAYELLWSHLAPAQYMTNDQMDDLAFTRGNVSRPQAELLAGRVAALRQCFF